MENICSKHDKLQPYILEECRIHAVHKRIKTDDQ